MAVLGWKELRALNDRHQSGDFSDVPQEDWLGDFDPNAEDAQEQYEKRYYDTFVKGKASADERMAYLKALQDVDFRPKYTEEDVLNSGYGESKFDTRIPFDTWIKDPINYRSNLQSAVGQIANGIGKMGFYGIATFADNIAGLINGMIDVGIDAVDGDGFHPTESFRNNFLSEQFNALRDWSDRVMPNYRTREEEEDQDNWWKHINANFIGDTFIKNLGFTIGAGASGGVWSKLFRLGHGKVVNQAYKAALAAAGGDAEAEAAFQRVLQGSTMQSAEKIYNTFEKTRKSFNRLNWESQIIGGIGGAMGESRMEALMAAKEFRDAESVDARNEYESSKQKLQQEIFNNPAYLGEEPVYDGFGNQVDSRPVLNPEGERVYADRLAELRKNYDDKSRVIDAEAENLANSVYWPNMLLLTGSNIVMFGRMFAGGFKTQAKAKVRGSFGDYRQKGSGLGTAGKIFGTAMSEGTEELSQKIISEGMKDIASRNISAFNDDKYDENSIKDVASWVSSICNTAISTIRDTKSWEEFAVGFLTGGLSSVMMGEIKKSTADARRSADAAKELNKRISDPKFKALWEGLVRHNHFENIKDVLLNSKVSGKDEEIKDKNGNPVGTQFAWQTINDAQIISDVTMFADAGRLEDLEAYVDSFADVTEDDIIDMNGMISDDTIADFDKKSPQEKVAWIKDRAEQVKKAIDQYRNFYNSIDFLSFGTSNKDAINEFIYTKSQLQNFEDRYKKLSDEVISAIRPTIEEVAKEKRADGSYSKDAEIAQQLLSSEDDMRRVFGGRAIDIRGTYQDRETTLGDIANQLDNERQEKVLNILDDWGAFTKDPNVKQMVQDMQSLVRSRQDFYARLFDPRGRKSYAERHSESKKTDEEAAAKQQESARKKNVDSYIAELNNAKDIGEYVNIYSQKIPQLDAETQKMLDEEIEKNPKIKDFEKKVDDTYKFFGGVKDRVQELAGDATNPAQINAAEELDSALDEISDSIDAVLINMPKGANPVVEISKKMIEATADKPASQDLIRAVLEEKLGNLALSNNLGKIKPAAPAVGGTGNGSKSGLNPDGSYTNKSGVNFKVGDKVVNKASGEVYTITSLDGKSYAITEERTDGSAGGMSASIEGLDGFALAPEDEIENSKSFDEVSSKIDLFTNAEDAELNDFSAGDFSSYPDLTLDERAKLASKAQDRIEALKVRKGGIVTSDANPAVSLEDSSEDSPYKEYVRQENMLMETNALPLNKLTVYDTTQLKKGKVVPFHSTKENGVEETLAWMRRHRVQDFIDSGALIALYDAYRRKGDQLPIYFVGNPHYLENNKQNNPFAGLAKSGKYPTTSEVLMAVEMTDENREILKPFEQLINEDSLITIEGTQYQVIGEMWNPEIKLVKDKKTGTEQWFAGSEKISEAEKPAYESMKKQAAKVWDYAIAKSILPQYQSELSRSYSAAFPLEGKWYVAKSHPTADTQESDTHNADWSTGERLHTTLNYVMSGRNETRDVKEKKIPLRNSLTDYESVDGEYHFVLHGKDTVYTEGSPVFPMSINAPAGSLWMATKAANGNWEWTPITIGLTTDFDFEEEKDSAIAKRIVSALDTLFAPSNPAATEEEHKADFLRRMQAQKVLRDTIYLGKGNTIYLQFTEGTPVVWFAGARCTSPADVLAHIGEIGYRFQVSDDMLTTNLVDLVSLIDAGILGTDMRSFIRRGASLGVNFLEDRGENGELVTPYPASSSEDVARTPGSNFNESQFAEGYTSGDVSNVRIGSAGYMLKADGSVYYMASRNLPGDRVEDRGTIASVKAIAEIMSGKPKDYAGNSWVIDTRITNKDGKQKNRIQYTELYERVIDGITVQMVREGENGAIRLASNSQWQALQASPDIKIQGTMYGKPEISEEQKAAQDQYEFDRLRAEEAKGNTPTETPTPAKPKRRHRSPITIQDDEIAEMKDDEFDNCG